MTLCKLIRFNPLACYVCHFHDGKMHAQIMYYYYHLCLGVQQMYMGHSVYIYISFKDLLHKVSFNGTMEV